MTATPSDRRPRRAFTLVELLVSLALIVFIMSILSAAFAAASKSFRDLKAAGDLAEQLRGAMTMLRRDLAQCTFDGGQKRHLSDPLFWTNGPPQKGGFFRLYQDTLMWNAGVQASQAGPPTPGPTEIPTFVSTRSFLHFSVTLPGQLPGDFFSTDTQTPGGQLFDPAQGYTNLFNQDLRYQPLNNPPQAVLKSQYAEVAWWIAPSLNPDGTQAFTATEPGQTAQPLFTLCRRVRLIWPEGPNLATNQTPSITTASPAFDEVSAPGPLGATAQVNGPTQATMPPFRFAMNCTAPYGPLLPTTDSSYAGVPRDPSYVYPPPVPPYPAPLPRWTVAGRVDDIVVDNVLSFDVRLLLDVTQDPSAQFRDLFDQTGSATATSVITPFLTASNNSQYNATSTARVFDTWSSQKIGAYDYTSWQTPGSYASIPMFKNAAGQMIRIQAIQVTLRLWDPKSQLSRQVSMIQGM
jgi:prepilin-type N-terminal cleavage/methylation domain-containing protein